MQSVLNRYLDKVIKDNRTIDARGVMQVNRMIELTMDEVFINLTVRTGNTANVIRLTSRITFSAMRMENPEESEFERAVAGKFVRVSSDADEDIFIPSGLPSFKGERLASGIETGVTTDELWTRHNAWVLLGDPGAGKTTLLNHFALESARAYKTWGGHLPILLPLRLFAAEWEQQPTWTPQNAVLNYLADKGLSEIGFEHDQEREELLGIFKQALNEGRTLLLFDGLDEQRKADIQRKSVAAIESLLQYNPGNRFLVSSRIIGYDAAPLGSGFNTATLEPFTDEQMEAFFRQWIYAVEKHEDIVVDESTKKRAKEKAEELIQQVKNNTGIRALATNPLLCTIIGLIRRQGATLPQLRAELYKLCIDTFIFNWELQKRRREDQQGSLNKDQTQAVLEELALYFHENCPENRASQQTITDIIGKFLIKQEGMSAEDAAQKAGQLLSLIRDVSGLLIDRGSSEYGFFHLTFQEYLAARAITRRKREIERYLGQHLFEPRWREVIRLAAAHQGMKDEETGSEFIEAILRCKHPREAQMHYAFRLAFLCLKEARVELATWDRMFSEWVRLYWDQPEMRNLLLRLLQQQGENNRYRPDALQPFITALKDEDRVVRWSAADALGEIKDPVAVPALLNALKDEDSIVRWSAASALGQIHDPSAVPALLAALKDEDDILCWSAAMALGQIKSPNVAPGMIEALKGMKSNTRWSVFATLGQIKDPTVLPALLDALKDEVSDVRSTAAAALGEIKDPSVVPALLAALKDEDSNVRSSAVAALGEIKDPSIVPALLAMLKDKNGDVRRSATAALGEIKDPSVVPALLAMLKDKNGDVRRSATTALGEIKDTAVVPTLLSALKVDKNSDVRSAAAAALGEIKDRSVVSSLLSALKVDKNSDVRSAAAAALGEIKDRSVVSSLLAALKDDKNNGVRRSVVGALGEIKDPAAVPALLAVLKDDKNSSVRSSAAAALGEIKDITIVPALLAALKDKNSSVRRSVVGALGEIKDPAAVPALLVTFKDKNGNVRMRAAEAIEKIDLGTQLCPD